MLTVPPWPMEKLFQLTIALFDVWLIVNDPFDGVPMVAEPDATEPPVGSAGAACAGVLASIAPAASMQRRIAELPRYAASRLFIRFVGAACGKDMTAPADAAEAQRPLVRRSSRTMRVNPAQKSNPPNFQRALLRRRTMFARGAAHNCQKLEASNPLPPIASHGENRTVFGAAHPVKN